MHRRAAKIRTHRRPQCLRTRKNLELIPHRLVGLAMLYLCLRKASGHPSALLSVSYYLLPIVTTFFPIVTTFSPIVTTFSPIASLRHKNVAHVRLHGLSLLRHAVAGHALRRDHASLRLRPVPASPGRCPLRSHDVHGLRIALLRRRLRADAALPRLRRLRRRHGRPRLRRRCARHGCLGRPRRLRKHRVLALWARRPAAFQVCARLWARPLGEGGLGVGEEGPQARGTER